jgi:flagellar transcriptional activator FlhC
MMGLAEHARLALAIALLERGARVSIVRHLTDLPRMVVRRLYREVLGVAPAAGQLPTTARVMGTRLRQVQASLWASLYRGLGGPGICQILDPQALLAAHDLYLQVARGQGHPPTLDLNDAWVVARDLRSGAAELRPCPRCQIHYLVCSEPRLPPTCPLCALRARALRAARGREVARGTPEHRPPRARDAANGP